MASTVEHNEERLDLALLDEQSLQRTAKLFRAFADPGRLAVLLLLGSGEQPVGGLCERLGEQMSTVSQRLRFLLAEGLVGRRRVGKQIFYSLSDGHVAEMLHNAMEHSLEGLLGTTGVAR